LSPLSPILLTRGLPDEINLLIPYDVGVAVYISLFCVLMERASPEDVHEQIATLLDAAPHGDPVIEVLPALAAQDRSSSARVGPADQRFGPATGQAADQ
jgi:hypothetical protein